MRSDQRWLLVTGGNLLILFLTLQVNHYLATIPASLFLFGLPVGFAALRLNLNHGLAASALIGFFYDTLTPFPLGTAFILFTLTFTIVYAVRSRFHREEAFSAVIVVLLANLFLFAAFSSVSAVLNGSAGHPGRLIVDLILSQIVAALATGWFFAFQIAILELFGIHLDEEQREAR
jgi:cell shape-determining protein MreD